MTAEASRTMATPECHALARLTEPFGSLALPAAFLSPLRDQLLDGTIERFPEWREQLARPSNPFPHGQVFAGGNFYRALEDGSHMGFHAAAVLRCAQAKLVANLVGQVTDRQSGHSTLP